MSVILVSTQSSRPFAERVAGHLGVPLTPLARRQFPDGESYLRFDLGDRFALLEQHVVIVGATDSPTSIDEVYRLGCTAAKSGAASLVLLIPYFGYATMERAT